ncbi:hypothetical protein THRCLA_00299 [Thraustotheca clavata]|uniref:Ketopantoate reductase C-terminal domain-containing protein n=1 Tax=Thraustotheca clavata TaxID=74557 RepID=A0A1W0ABY4_9STRA|nr:hypothetical protein THRCLA_00299 [Thraustotheca clavata]
MVKEGSRIPRVAIVCNGNSSVSMRRQNLAKYLAACMTKGGWAEKVWFVSVKGNVSSAPYQVRRRDGAILSSDEVNFTSDTNVLANVDAIFLCCDLAEVDACGKIIANAIKGSKTKHVIVHLEASLKRKDGLDKAYFSEKVFLQGGACFDVVIDDNGVLLPLSNGAIFLERLAKEKESALFCFSIIESCGIQVISRRNMRAIHWSNAIINTLHSVCALTGLSTNEALRDRRCRLIYADMMHEMTKVLDNVQKDKNWHLDHSGNVTLPIPLLLSFLPLPNFIFNNICLGLVDFGVGVSDDGHPLLTTDVTSGLSTELPYEYDDVFELSEKTKVPTPTLLQMKKLVLTAVETKSTTRISPAALYSAIQPSSESRNHSRTFIIKVLVTILMTVWLIYSLFF